MENEWTILSEIDLTMVKSLRIDTRDFMALPVNGSGDKTMEELIGEGLVKENFIDGEDLMEWIRSLMKRNREKPLWIGRSDIKYIGLWKCRDDHWLVMDRDCHPIEWKEI